MNSPQQILIVEDDSNDAYFIQRTFQHSGITRLPRICTKVEEAIAYLQGTGDL